MELQERIYQLRKERNLTQEELADRLGVSRQAVSRWEMGTARPEIDNLTAMSRIFGLTLDELVTGEKLEQVDIPVKTEKPNARKWVIAWAVTYLVIVAAYGVWMFVEWKFKGTLIALVPGVLAVQLINLALKLGVVFVIAYFIRKICRK